MLVKFFFKGVATWGGVTTNEIWQRLWCIGELMPGNDAPDTEPTLFHVLGETPPAHQFPTMCVQAHMNIFAHDECRTNLADNLIVKIEDKAKRIFLL